MEVVLFNVLPQMVDIVIACTYLATMMQPWVAGIVLVTVSSYVPLTVIITERRMVVRKVGGLDQQQQQRQYIAPCVHKTASLNNHYRMLSSRGLHSCTFHFASHACLD